MVIKIISRVYAVLLLVICSVCVIHTIITRTPSDFLSILKYVVPVTIFLFFSNYSVDEKIGSDGEVTRYYPSAREAFEGAIIGSVFLIPIGVVILSVYSSAVDTVAWMQSPNLDDYVVKVISAVAVLIAGHVLFLFRQKYRPIYGATELLVGVAIAMNNGHELLKNGEFDLTMVFAFITAGVYLVVRGLDNIHEGSKQLKEEQSKENRSE
ncbi:MAG: hypothetical protein WBK19_17180 [Azonexus sp.]